MLTLFVLMLPAFLAAGLLYLLMTLGDSVVSASADWVGDRRPGSSRDQE